MYYTNANKTGMAGYHGPATKVIQTPYNSVQKAELSAIILLLTDISDAINIVIDSQYVEQVVLNIETMTLIPDATEITRLFSEMQHLLWGRTNPIFITHI